MGNLLSKVSESLKTFIFHRRENRDGVHSSEEDHSQLNSSSQSKAVTDNKQTEISAKAIPVTNVKVSIGKCSEFYWACRNNDLNNVKKLLKTMKHDEIDKIEPNGSTALHAACFYGHKDIVELLLEEGADRAIHNKHKNFPFDEALNDEIKELFFRIPNTNRYISDTGTIVWELVDDEVLEKAMEERQIIKSVYETVSLEKMFERIEKNYIGKGLTKFNGIEYIRRFFNKATNEQNPLWIIKAYTAETDFYKILNIDLAACSREYESERRYLIALLSHHPILNQFTFIGNSYRVMQLNHYDLQKYQINTLFMTKSFLSSSIEQELAAYLLCQQEMAKKLPHPKQRLKADGSVIKFWVMCIYNIKHPRTALHIENSSQYAMEGEILIMPHTVFKIKRIEKVQPSYVPEKFLITEIELEECDQYLSIQTTKTSS